MSVFSIPTHGFGFAIDDIVTGGYGMDETTPPPPIDSLICDKISVGAKGSEGRDLWIGNDQSVWLEGLHDAQSGVHVDNAMITATLKNATENTVMGQIFPILLLNEGAGTYAGVLEDGLQLVPGWQYWLEIKADAGNDVLAFWRLQLTARFRSI